MSCHVMSCHAMPCHNHGVSLVCVGMVSYLVYGISTCVSSVPAIGVKKTFENDRSGQSPGILIQRICCLPSKVLLWTMLCTAWHTDDILWCNAMSCHATSCHTTSCHIIISCHIRPCHVISCHVTSCMSYHITSHHVTSFRGLSCNFMSCYVISSLAI